MQKRTLTGDRSAVQIVQARTTRDRIRCNTTQCRTRGSRRRQRRRLKQAPPATPPAPRPRGPVPARTVPLKPSLRSAPGAHKGVPRLQSLPGLIPRRLRRGCSFQAKPCFSPNETQLPVCQSPGPVPIPRKILPQADISLPMGFGSQIDCGAESPLFRKGSAMMAMPQPLGDIESMKILRTSSRNGIAIAIRKPLKIQDVANNARVSRKMYPSSHSAQIGRSRGSFNSLPFSFGNFFSDFT